jgi:hypothetical protein
MKLGEASGDDKLTACGQLIGGVGGKRNSKQEIFAGLLNVTLL